MADRPPVRTAESPVRRAGRPLRPWSQIDNDAASCSVCGLSRDRTTVVFGDGNPDADLLFLGVAPSRTDDLLGAAFSGSAGNLVDNLLGDHGLTREDAYLCHLVKCRPLSGREPLPDEVGACAPHVLDQLAHVNPRVIVSLGELPTRLLLRRDVPLERVAGYRLPVGAATLVATIAPQTALQGPSRLLTQFQHDISVAVRVVTGELAPADAAVAELGVVVGERQATRR